MLLFIISFLMVFISSYFITSVIAPKKSVIGIIYLFLGAFAQIVFTFEFLSLFSVIKEFWVLLFNFIFLIISFYFWNKKEKPFWSFDCNDLRNRIVNSLKLDKSLMWLYVGFCIFVLVSLILCFLFPITNMDAQAYHVARSLFWVLQGSLKHFDVPDVRNLCLPINSEILYSWVILFIKKDAFLGFFSFIGYILSVISIYNILGFCGYCVRKRLWIIFMLSSFASVIVQVSGTETDIIIAGLVLSSVFLFWYALRTDKMVPVFMASLAYALAIGTKTTALIAVPGIGLLMIAICFYLKKYKPFAYFLGFGIINFLIFSAYNYVLNFIQFSNFMGPVSFMVVSKNYFGFKGMVANFIKYWFMLIDFTGFRWSDYLGPHISHFRGDILNYLHLGYIKDGLYSVDYTVNRYLLEPLMGTGVLGILVFVPSLIWALVKPIFKFRTKKVWFTFIFAAVFIVNLLVMSYLLVYMAFSVRFMMTFILFASPVLVYSYLSNRNPIKYIIIIFSLFYMIFVTMNLWARPFSRLGPIFKKHPSLTYIRYLAHCKDYEESPIYINATCLLTEKIRSKFSNNRKILSFMGTSDNIYLLKMLEFEGYKIDFRNMEDADKIDFSKYNIVISTDKGQAATLVKDYENRKNDYIRVGHKAFFKKVVLVPCSYNLNPNLEGSKNSESKYPFQVGCAMTENFLVEKNLNKIAIVGLTKSRSEAYNYYIIYAVSHK